MPNLHSFCREIPSQNLPDRLTALQYVVGKLSPHQIAGSEIVERCPRVLEPAAGEPTRAERQIQRQAVPVAPPPLPVQQPLLPARLERHRQPLLQLAGEVPLAGKPQGEEVIPVVV